MARSLKTRLLTTGILVVTLCAVLAGTTQVSSTANSRWGHTTAPVVVAKPNGGQTIEPGTAYTIRWFARETDTVRIEYSTDGGIAWLLIDAAVPANTGDEMRQPETGSSRHYDPLPPAGSYVWDVPHTEHNSVLLRVSDRHQPEKSDISDAPFAISRTVLSGWTVQSVGAAVTLFSVSIVDESVAWTCGLGGVVFRTTTGGTSWSQVQNVPIEGNHIFGTRESSAFVCANLTNDGRVYRTTDGGASWNVVLQYAGTGARVKSLHMFDADSGVALGDPVGGFWRVFKTTDGGSTWDTLAQIPQHMSEVGYREAFTWVGNRSGWFGSENGRVYHTSDEGKTWSYAPTANGMDVFGLAFISEQAGLASTVFRNIYRTTNAGSSWSYVSTVPGTPMSILAFIAAAPVPSPRWWAANMDEIYRTTDQGATWTYETMLDGIPLNDIAMKAVPAAGVVVGYAAGAASGALLKYTETTGPPQPTFSVMPAALQFGSVVVGESKTDSVIVRNTGGGTLNVLTGTIIGPSAFTILTAFPLTLVAAESAAVVVRFSPTSPGTLSASAVFTHNAASSPDSVVLLGTTPEPLFTVDPSSLLFGDVNVGDSLSLSAKVYNTGTANLDVTAIASDNPRFTVGTSPGTVVPGDSLEVVVKFKPAAGPALGNMVFTHNAAGSPDTLFLSGNGVPVGPSPKFLTLEPEEVFDENPLKAGKSNKAVKRAKPGKPIDPLKNVPNRTNILSEIVAQGVFAPGTTEGDAAGGMVIGISHMVNVGGKWKADKESSKVRCWMRLSKWDFKKNLGKNHADFQKTLHDKSLGFHDGTPSGLDFTTDGKNKPLLKQQKKLTPKKHDNALLAELVALKVNIGASQLGTTPAGFGDLLYENDGSAYDEQSIPSIAATADQMMTYWQAYDSSDYAELYDVVYDLNRAFPGSLPLDTVQFNAYAGSTPLPLVVRGEVELASVPFLKLPVPFVATTTPRLNNEVEAPEEFEDEDWEEGEGVPVAAKLYQNYPNPFNPGTTLSFRLLENSLVTIRVYNTLGQQVAELFSGEEVEEGYNEVSFNAGGLSSGVYFCRIDAQGLGDEGLRSVVTNKMLLLK